MYNCGKFSVFLSKSTFFIHKNDFLRILFSQELSKWMARLIANKLFFSVFSLVGLSLARRCIVLLNNLSFYDFGGRREIEGSCLGKRTYGSSWKMKIGGVWDCLVTGGRKRWHKLMWNACFFISSLTFFIMLCGCINEYSKEFRSEKKNAQ